MQNNIDLIVPLNGSYSELEDFCFPVNMIDKKYKSLWKIKTHNELNCYVKRARSWTPAPQ